MVTSFLIFCQLGLLVFVVQGWLPHDHAKEQELRTLLFQTNNYNNQIRPYTKTTIQLLQTLYTIRSIDVKTETMDSTFYLTMIWVDPRLTWIGNANFSSLIRIYSNPADVWTPRLQIFNSLGNVAVLGDPNAPVMVGPNGAIQWTFGMSLTTNCYCDVTYYPFDTQKCQFRFFALGHNVSDVEISPTLFDHVDPIQMEYFQPNGEWEFVGKEIEIDENVVKGEKSRFIIFHVKFRRRPLFHFINSLIPVTLFSSLSCATFRLPAESGEKIGFCVTVLLGFAVYLTILTDFIPSTSIFTSYLSIYLVSVLILCILAVFTTTFVLECHHADPKKPVTKWTGSFIRKILVTCSCKGSCCSGCWRRRGQVCNDPKSENEDCDMDEGIKTKSVDVTWQEISRLVDQTAFVFFVVVSFLLTILIYSLLLYGYIKQ